MGHKHPQPGAMILVALIMMSTMGAQSEPDSPRAPRERGLRSLSFAPTFPLEIADVSASPEPTLGRVITLSVQVTSTEHEEDVTITIRLPERVRVADGQLTWRGSLRAGMTIEHQVRLVVQEPGDWAIDVRAFSLSGNDTKYTDAETIHLITDDQGGRAVRGPEYTFTQKPPPTSAAFFTSQTPRALAASALASSGMVTIGGTVSYEAEEEDGRPTDPRSISAPLARARIELWDADTPNNRLLASSNTQSSPVGHFSFSVPNTDPDGTGIDPYLLIWADDNGAPGGERVWVIDAADLPYFFVELIGIDLDDGVYSFSPTIPRTNPEAQAFYIFDNLANAANSYLLRESDWPVTNPVEVVFPEQCVQRYPNSCFVDRIYIIDAHKRMADVAIHEYGHFVMSQYSGRFDLFTACAFEDVPWQHAMWQELNRPACAWSEGWPDFLQMAVQDDPDYIGVSLEDVDTPLQLGQVTANASHFEGVVAASLWDLYDSHAEPFDELADGFDGQSANGIWHMTTTDGPPDNDQPATITEFWTHLLNDRPTNACYGSAILQHHKLNYEPFMFTLAISADPSAGGTVSPSPAPNCPGGKYEDGTSVTLTASPSAGYVFTGWSGDATGTANPLTVVMDANQTITAHFAVPTPTPTSTQTPTPTFTATSTPTPIPGYYLGPWQPGCTMTIDASPIGWQNAYCTLGEWVLPDKALAVIYEAAPPGGNAHWSPWDMGSGSLLTGSDSWLTAECATTSAAWYGLNGTQRCSTFAPGYTPRLTAGFHGDEMQPGQTAKFGWHMQLYDGVQTGQMIRWRVLYYGSGATPTATVTGTPPTATPTPVPTATPCPCFSTCRQSLASAGKAGSPPGLAALVRGYLRLRHIADIVELLRAVRDQVMAGTSEGQRLIGLYEGFSPNLAETILPDPGLTAEGDAVLDLFAPGLQALVDGRGTEITVTQEQVDAVETFLDHLSAVADPDLQQVVASERLLRPLQAMVGLTMDQAWDRVNGYSLEWLPPLDQVDPLHVERGNIVPVSFTLAAYTGAPAFDPTVSLQLLDIVGTPMLGPIGLSADPNQGLVYDGAGGYAFNLPTQGLLTVPYNIVVGFNSVSGVLESAQIWVDEPANLVPTADAGPDKTVLEGSWVDLSASGSSDPDGDALAYLWEVAIADGPPITLTTPTGVTTRFLVPDNGSYTLRLNVDDGRGGTASDEVLVVVENVSSAIDSVSAPVIPSQLGTAVEASATFTDPGLLDSHTALWAWGDGSMSEGLVEEGDERATVTGGHTYTSAGVYTLTLYVADDDGATASATFRYIVVYNPQGGFVTGGGWFNSPEGSYSVDPSFTGKVHVGFNARYPSGASVPTGETQITLAAGDFHFHSEAYEWLVISGSLAQLRGTGTLNGEGGYSILVTMSDGDVVGSETDMVRVKIWQTDSGLVIYDTQPADLDASPVVALGGGSIVIHQTE